jgi:hypothetical protein
MAAKLRVVCATKQPSHEYFQKTALGCSLSLPTASADTIELRVFCDNREGLPSAYNQAIDEAKSDSAVLVFVHDDVQLCDFHWPSRILRGLESFHIVGVAGNKRRIPRQPSWAFIDPQFTWDALENLSGTVGHGSGYPPQQVSVFGPSEQEVKLLDGLLLAVQSDALHATDLRFDQRFAFHFYDLDFCREAELRKLTMGTCSISLVHASGGQFDTPEWTSAYAEYLRKWKD